MLGFGPWCGVTAAFMATPLRKRDVIAKLPLSVSDVSGSAMYLHLYKALNGLRSASQEWFFSCLKLFPNCNLNLILWNHAFSLED
jgi:hypothetical protein